MSKEIPRYLSRKNQQSRSTHATMSKSQKRSPHWNLALRDHLPLSGGATRGFNPLKTLLPTATPTRQHSDRKPCRLWRWQGRIRIQTCWTLGSCKCNSLRGRVNNPGQWRSSWREMTSAALATTPTSRDTKGECCSLFVVKCNFYHTVPRESEAPVSLQQPANRGSVPSCCGQHRTNTGQIVGHHTLQRLG